MRYSTEMALHRKNKLVLDMAYRTIKRDRRVMMNVACKLIRHNDGLKEIAQKIKQKATDVINYVKDIGVAKFIIKTVVAISSLILGFYVGKKIKNIPVVKEKLRLLNIKLSRFIEDNEFIHKVKQYGAKGIAALKSLRAFAWLSRMYYKLFGKFSKAQTTPGEVITPDDVEVLGPDGKWHSAM